MHHVKPGTWAGAAHFMTTVAPPRILLMGNIAGNSYTLAKLLRRRGIEVDCFSHGYDYHIGSPEWEDADFKTKGEIKELGHDWSSMDLNGFERPHWYFEEFSSDASKFQYLAQAPSQVDPEMVLDPGLKWHPFAYTAQYGLRGCKPDFFRYGRLFKKVVSLALGWFKNLPPHYLHLIKTYRCCAGSAGFSGELTVFDIAHFEQQAHFAHLFSKYDLIQVAGLYDPGYPVLLAPDKPLVYFEHGTLREAYERPTAINRMMVLACYLAKNVVITNADCWGVAEKMGVADKAVFIPHPIDDSIFQPAAEPELRREFQEQTSSEFIIYSPARHTWDEKRNYILIEGFAQARSQGVPCGLVLCEWGKDMDRSQELLAERGIAEYTTWLPVQPKLQSARNINACHIVIDQFFYQAFGTVAAEALSCGKAVVMKFDAEAHRKVFNELPPIVDAKDPPSVADAIHRLWEDADLRKNIENKSHAWFEKYHSSELVVRKHLDIYSRILDIDLHTL